MPLRLKAEINTREHFVCEGFVKMPFAVASRWFNGSCAINTYSLNELLGTKLRALYQRSKERDLFDLAIALDRTEADPERIVAAFKRYMRHGGYRVTARIFRENLAGKLNDKSFAADIGPLLASEYEWDLRQMGMKVVETLVEGLDH